ncbi:MAG: flippase-like domain-containing protein [Deltaproteobacteria bacterium]|nr:flippase-like domain-containing protein [Deltaproteobacteria bacterium]
MVKAAVSALLLYLSLRRVDLDSVGQRLGGLDWGWIALVLVTLGIQIPLLSLRWREIVTICGAKLPLATALRYNFIGQFFSQVLPSTVGGDAVRIWLLARGGAGWPVAIYSVLIDRVVGVSALAILVVACLPWTFQLVHDPVARAALALLGFGALAAASIFLSLGLQRLRVLERWWLGRHLAAASRMAWRLCRPAAGARIAALSFAIHFMTVTVAWGAAMAAHASVDFVHVLFLVLPVILIATVPVSIAGWGVRESAMILAFSYAGLAESDGLIVSILFGAATLAAGAIGGIVWVASGYRWRSVKTIEAETLAHGPSPDRFGV